MEKFNFETRELCPYRDDWCGEKEPKVGGCLWYIKERDGIYLLDNKNTKQEGPIVHHPDDEYCVAKGLPAAILAQGEDLLQRNFNFVKCYQQYFEEVKELFPEHRTYYMPSVFEDWEFTLEQLRVFNQNKSGYFYKLALMRVGGFLRDISNPYHIEDIVDRIRSKTYYSFQYPNKEKPQLIMSDMPSVKNRTEAPMIFAFDIDKNPNTAKLQADGFIATIINLAIYYFWNKRWSEYDFTDISVIEHMIKAQKNIYPIIDTSDLSELSFDLPIEVEEICRAYMTAFEPIMQKVWRMKPDVQLECIDGDNIYTYIYAHEVTSSDRLQVSELYVNLNNKQKHNLISYGRRFLEWMCKTYPITTASQFRVMQAMSKDMPPIQLTIQQNTTITREGEPKKNAGKFRYILTDDKKEIRKIHKRIEKHLDSPAGLRDELLQLQQEGLVALPLRSSTAIFREVERLWGKLSFKEHTFVTTWGRIKK